MENLSFIHTIERYISHCEMFAHGGKTLVALSGGADSVALLHVLLRLGHDCAAAHCNFGLRGEESLRDERFVRQMCESLGVTLFVKNFDVDAYQRQHKVSVEMACRELRYDWFRTLMAEHGYSYLAVAHHADDNIETLLLNLMRGTGITGAAGIKPCAGNVCRPLLCVHRDEIERFLKENGIAFVTDSTNRQSDFSRNKLRNIILPSLYREFPAARQGMAKSLGNLLQNLSLFNELIDKEKTRFIKPKNGCELSIDFMHDGLSEALLFEFLKPFGFTALQCAQILAAKGMSGKQFFSPSHKAVTTSHSLDIVQLAPEDEGEYEVCLANPENLPVALEVDLAPTAPFSPKLCDGKTSICLDANVLSKRITLRHWREGDRMRPFGMRGTRLVSDIFTDAHLSLAEKDSAWLLTIDGEIAWVLHHRASALYPVALASNNYIIIRYLENE